MLEKDLVRLQTEVEQLESDTYVLHQAPAEPETKKEARTATAPATHRLTYEASFGWGFRASRTQSNLRGPGSGDDRVCVVEGAMCQREKGSGDKLQKAMDRLP